MMQVDEEVKDKDLSLYVVEGFIYFMDESGVPKYDFRCKSLDTAIDLIVAIANRLAYKNASASLSLTMGILQFSCDVTGAAKVETRIRECLDITNWQIVR